MRIRIQGARVIVNPKEQDGNRITIELPDRPLPAKVSDSIREIAITVTNEFHMDDAAGTKLEDEIHHIVAKTTVFHYLQDNLEVLP